MSIRAYVELVGNVGVTRMGDLAHEGLVTDFYVRLGAGYEHNEELWTAAEKYVKPAGGKLWGWFWCDADQAGTAQDVLAADARLELDGILLNIEKPLEATPLGTLIGPIANLGKPVVAGMAGIAPGIAYDWRTLDRAGVVVEWECYVDSGEGQAPDIAIRELITPSRVCAGWRYRANVGGGYGWGEVDEHGAYRFYPQRREYELEVVHDSGWPPMLLSDRHVFDADWAAVGLLFGVVQYRNLRVALDTTRDAQAKRDLAGWEALAASARLPGAAKRGVSVYLLEVTPDDVLEAIAKGAA